MDSWSTRLETVPVEPGGTPTPTIAPLLVANLLASLDELAELLATEIETGSGLNAFLLAAGLNQIAEDVLHGEAISLARVARHIKRVAPRPLGSVAAATLRSAGIARLAVLELSVGMRRAVAWQRTAASLVDVLADLAVMGAAADTDSLRRLAALLLDGRAHLPKRMRRSIIRLPSCFRNFDQRPGDLERLTVEFSQRWPDLRRTIAVVGVRTSGSYTAPLHGAYLRALGYMDVRVITLRPGQRWGRVEADAIAKVAESGGLALITDDAPKSGGSVARTAAELERHGLDPKSIVMLLQTLSDTPGLPERLERYPSIVLPWPQWSVHAQLEPEAVRRTIGEMLAPSTEVLSVELGPPASPSSRRGHVEARYRVQLRDRSSGLRSESEIYARGVGLGYLGDHALAVMGPLQAFFPELIGLKDGVLYRRWLPSVSRLRAVDAGETASVRTVVRYALSRAEALRVPTDVSLNLIDRGAVWQRAADFVGRAFGIGAQFARPVLYPLIKELLRVERPSVIDGATDVASWFDRGEQEGFQKVDFDDRPFNSLDIYCYDHAFDVAGFASGSSNPRVAPALKKAYARESTSAIDPERWLLYRLVHVVERHRDEARQSVETERELARELQHYYRETVFADVNEGQAEGPLCVFDVDWVLETRALGFPGTTPAGALALRALTRHGFRVALASGRSIGEIRERCGAYRLIGGVAEYGAVAYDTRSDLVHDLLSSGERERLNLVRECLSSSGAVVDPEYRGAVRAYRFEDSGRRRGLRPDAIAAVLEATGLVDEVRPIPGKYQTDFMVNTIDKGVGLRALLSGSREDPYSQPSLQVALAVGDSAEDLPTMKLARLAMAPANADAAVVAAGIRVARRANQLGLAQAVAELIGHKPGGCAECKTTHLTPRSRLLLTALAAQDASRWGKARQALSVASALIRYRR